MYGLIKKFSDANPERFNKDFITSRKDQDVLEYARDIFKGLEILDEFEVLDVSYSNDESSFGPIKNQHKYYKSILPSRLDKIHYKIKITPSDTVVNRSPLFKKNGSQQEGSFIKEGDIYVNKLVDNIFYINEGVRYFLIYQIVDNATYGVRGSVVLKSLFMPITAMKKDVVVTPEFGEAAMELPNFELQLFSRNINPVLYIMSKEAYEQLKMIPDNTDDILDARHNLKSDALIDALKKFFKTEFVITDNIEDFLDTENIYVFKMSKGDENVYFGIDKVAFDNNPLAKIMIGCLSEIASETKKKPIRFSLDDLRTPWFWIDQLSNFLTKNAADEKKLDKIRAVLISLTRLVDDATRKTLDIDPDDKKDTFSVIRYMMREFESLVNEDSRDLENKRVRLLEYQMYPLRKYFSEQIYRVLNSPNRSRVILERVLSGLSPMFVIKQTVVNELLRYYNSANEMNLYSSLLKYTFRGPQAIGKSVSNEQRDLHPSYTGRLSLIASSAGDPGISGSMVPFIQMEDYHFKKQ